LLPVALLANMMANGASHRDTAEDTRRCASNVQTLEARIQPFEACIQRLEGTTYSSKV
jgi:hypothetical protein